MGAPRLPEEARSAARFPASVRRNAGQGVAAALQNRGIRKAVLAVRSRVPTDERHVRPNAKLCHANEWSTPGQRAGRCAGSCPAGPRGCSASPERFRRIRDFPSPASLATPTREPRFLLQAAAACDSDEAADRAEDFSPTRQVARSAAECRAAAPTAACAQDKTPAQMSCPWPDPRHACPTSSTRSRRHKRSSGVLVIAMTSFPSGRGICLKMARCTYSRSAMPRRVPVRFDVSM